MSRADELVKEVGIEENFGDPKAVIHEWKDKSGEIQKAEVLYGGEHGGVSQGHGHFVAQNIDGLFQVTLDRNPDSVDGGRHLIESIHKTDAYNGEARLDRIRAKESVINDLRYIDPSQPSLVDSVKELRDRFYACGSCGHDDNIRLKEEFNSVADRLFAERDRIRNEYRLQKEDIVRQAENLAYSTDYKSAKDQIKSLKEKMKLLPRIAKEDEDRLWSRFRQATDRLYDNANRDYEERKRKQEEARQIKESIVSEAERLSYSTDYNEAKKQMRVLQDRWKQSPRASKEDEDRLWSRFRQATDRLYDNANRDYEERKRKQEEARQRKESIVSEAERLSYSTDYNEAKKQMRALQDRWKQSPRASKEDEDRLWSRFRQASDRLYENSKRDFEKRQAQQSEAKAKKERVIYQIQNLVNTSDYRSASSEIKRLSDEFYNAGSAGKDNQELKERFNAARDRFYEAKKRASEQKHHEYIRSLQERIERKKEALSRLDNAIYNKQDQLDNLLSRPAPSYNNPRRWEIAANRNAKESSLNSAICDMKMKRLTIINEIAQLQSKLNSSC